MRKMVKRSRRGSYNFTSGAYASGGNNKMVMYKRLGINPVHSFKRMGAPLVIKSDQTNATALLTAGNTSLLSAAVISTGTGQLDGTRQFGFGLKFNISQLTNVADITNLFDQYRIKSVSLMISLSYNSAGAQYDGNTLIGARSSSMPIINIVTDQDDSNTPADQNAVLQLANCKTLRMGDRVIYHKCYPRAQQAIGALTAPAGGGAVSTGIGMLPAKTWIDNASVVDHYGVKVWIDCWPQVFQVPYGQIGLTITPTYHLEAKSVH